MPEQFNASIDYLFVIKDPPVPFYLIKSNVDPVGGPVGPVACHCLHHIRYGDNAGFKEDLLPLDPPGISGPVKTFVVLIHDIRQRKGRVDIFSGCLSRE